VERVWNESRPNRRLQGCSIPFTAIYGIPITVEHQIGWNLRFHPAALASKALTCRTVRIPQGVKAPDPVDYGDAFARMLPFRGCRLARMFFDTGHQQSPWLRLAAAVSLYCVLAAECDGCATVTNEIACNRPVPSGVGNEKRNGTKTRVPEIGASHTSASRSSTRYLIAGRSGT
jgi:hypothetical protein